jgi:transposase
VVAVSGVDGTATFDNHDEGHRKLLAYFHKRRVERAACEPTGNYGVDMMLALHGAGIVVNAINPRAARAFARASSTRAKTDQVDARSLLDFARRMPVEPWSPPRGAVLEFRCLSRRIGQLAKAGAAEKSRLKSLRATATTPKAVIESVERMIAAHEEEAESFVTLAMEAASRDAELRESVELLISINGIAERTAVKLLGEMAYWPDDLDIRQIVAMVGLDPRPVESGQHAGERRISKHGNAYVRATLYMAAHNAVLYEPVVRRYYDELVARGKHPRKAKVAVMRKLLHAIVGMLRSKSTFKPEKFRATASAPVAA